MRNEIAVRTIEEFLKINAIIRRYKSGDTLARSFGLKVGWIRLMATMYAVKKQV